jgi:probable F420-dependent oxidoreductase
MATVDVHVSLQADPDDRASWLQLARDAESAGFAALYAADHPGTAASPFVALAAAAAVTERITLGTCVVNAGMREPLALASEVATLDVVSDGRALLGIGAGHTPAEWTMGGRAYPGAAERVDRMIEVAEATQALLAGDEVTATGRHVVLAAARLERPRPVQAQVPLLVGGSGARVLAFAARRADVVGITGLGRTLPDGHRHDVAWSEAEVRSSLDAIAAVAGAAGRSPEVEALVQVVEITDDAPGAAEALAQRVPGATPDDLLRAPYAWIGTVDEIRTELDRHRRSGIDRFVVRPASVDAVRLILDR